MKYDFKDKVAIITGAAQGIGRRIALDIASCGGNIILSDINMELLEEAKKECEAFGVGVLAIKTDISNCDEVEGLIKKTMDKFGRIDILVNNAGILVPKTIEETTNELIDDTLDINIKGVLYTIRAVTPIMKSQKYGKIINMSSITGKNGDNSTSFAYGASKGAVITLTRSVARQLGPYNINCNALAPHAVMTEMMRYWDDEKKKSISEKIPLRRLATPEDISNATLFLASDFSSFITGETININGGYYMD